MRYLFTLALVLIPISTASPSEQSFAFGETLGIQSTLTAGAREMCAVKAPGTVLCWGRNGIARAQTSVLNATVVSSGAEHSCAIVGQGAIKCWGSNTTGQTSAPPSLVNVDQISAGYYHTCALYDKGSVKCWGENSNGQTTVPLGLGKVVSISTGAMHTCAVLDDGKVTCWGAKYGQNSPPNNLGKVTQISAGGLHTCIINTKGEVKCWDYNNSKSITTAPSGLGKVIQVSAGDSHTCVLNDQGIVSCWGSTEVMNLIKVPTGLGKVIALDSGESHNCIATDQGTVLCWGYEGIIAFFESMVEPAGQTLTRPSIVGFLANGNTLLALKPNNANNVQWFRDGLAIPGATSQKYVLSLSDLGHKLAVTVSFDSMALSSLEVNIPLTSLRMTPVPRIGGVPKVRQTLKAIPGIWDSGVFLSYKWYRNGKAIPRATTNTYKLVNLDKGSKISLSVTGSKEGYKSVVKTSFKLSVK